VTGVHVPGAWYVYVTALVAVTIFYFLGSPKEMRFRMRSWRYALAWSLLVAVFVPGSMVADGPLALSVAPRAPLVAPLNQPPQRYSWPAARRAILEKAENERPINRAVYEKYIDEKIDQCVRIAMGMSLFR
jgi:hypothetical protein